METNHFMQPFNRSFRSFGLLLLLVVGSAVSRAQQNPSFTTGDSLHTSIPGLKVNATVRDTGARHSILNLDRYRMECEVEVEGESGPLAGSCTVSVLKTDSLLLTMTGPFGILVGRLAASPTSMLYFDALRSEVLEMSPQSETVLERLPIPLNYNDLVHLIRTEVPFETSLYTATKNGTTDSTVIYQYSADERFVDFAKCSAKNGALLAYQRKSRKGEVLLNVSYADHEMMNGVLFPRSIVMTAPQQKSISRFHVSSLVLNPSNEHYSFSVPKGIKRTKLD